MVKKSSAGRKSAESIAGSAGPRKESAVTQAEAQASPLARARHALSRGNVRLARRLAREAAASGAEAQRPEAAALLERTRPDPKAILAALAVVAVILLAAVLGLLHGH